MMSSMSYHRPIGPLLLCFPPDNNPPSPLPLLSIRAEISIVDTLARVTLIQTFHNDLESKGIVTGDDGGGSRTQNIEAKYRVPIPDGAAVVGFLMVREDGRKIFGTVKGKKEAKQKYEKAKKEGKMTSLGEEVSKDVFSISVGNIPSNETVQIHLSYVIEISTSDTSSPTSGSIRFSFPTSIGQRYGPAPDTSPSISGGTQLASKDHPLNISVKIQMPGKIKSIACPSGHGIRIGLGKWDEIDDGDESRKLEKPNDVDDGFFASVNFISETFLSKDFILEILAEGLDQPRCFLESPALPSASSSSSSSALHLTLVPQFNLSPLKCQQEYIFLIDRSGSMQQESRIELAKKSLIVLLRGLPTKGTIFNVWSFGDSSEALWNEENDGMGASREYGEETLNEATKYVDSMTANFGGTKIQTALQNVFSSRSKTSPIPTSVFILSDGNVWNAPSIISYVQKTVTSSSIDAPLRLFSFGIGNGVSMELLDGISRVGNGVSLYVVGGESMQGKCARLVKAARTPLITDVEIEWIGGMTVDKAKELQQESEDFEMVEKNDDDNRAPPTSKSDDNHQPSKSKPPVNLFDPSTTMNEDPTPTGPPLAPKPKLFPTPLLIQTPENIPSFSPGIRWSVFAIIHHSLLQNVGLSHPEQLPPIKVKGKVLQSNQTVELDIPIRKFVASTRLSNNNESINPPSLIHTLAARKVIQDLEDGKGEKNFEEDLNQAKVKEENQRSANRKGLIVRFGEKYRLSSRETSWIAVDERKLNWTATNADGEVENKRKKVRKPSQGKPHFLDFEATIVDVDREEVDFDDEEEDDDDDDYEAVPIMKTRSRTADGCRSASGPAPLGSKRKALAQSSATRGHGTATSPVTNSDRSPELPPPPSSQAGMAQPALQGSSGLDRISIKRMVVKDFASNSARSIPSDGPSSMPDPNTIPESAEDQLTYLARLQKFNGAFQLTDDLLRLVLRKNPSIENGDKDDREKVIEGVGKLVLVAGCEGHDKDSVTASILAVVYMRKWLGDLAEAWEAMVEKADSFIQEVLPKSDLEQVKKLRGCAEELISPS